MRPTCTISGQRPLVHSIAAVLEEAGYDVGFLEPNGDPPYADFVGSRRSLWKAVVLDNAVYIETTSTTHSETIATSTIHTKPVRAPKSGAPTEQKPLPSTTDDDIPF